MFAWHELASQLVIRVSNVFVGVDWLQHANIPIYIEYTPCELADWLIAGLPAGDVDCGSAY